ncbi:MAG: Gfo/Idh/MocA family oxidoreductase, partial [Ornithinibacter sp.]
MMRVALAGFGSAGQTIHAPLLHEAGCHVAAVSTTDAGRARAAQEEFPGTKVVPRLEDLLALPGLDLVVLATPSGAHAEQVRAVIDAGIACLVDKPLAVDAQ